MYFRQPTCIRSYHVPRRQNYIHQQKEETWRMWKCSSWLYLPSWRLTSEFGIQYADSLGAQPLCSAAKPNIKSFAKALKYFEIEIPSPKLTWKWRGDPYKTTILYIGPSMSFHVNLGQGTLFPSALSTIQEDGRLKGRCMQRRLSGDKAFRASSCHSGLRARYFWQAKKHVVQSPYRIPCP